ncbi:MAG: hypothetical protein ABFS24_14645 [Pseudomonadota bacterium]
MLSEKTGRYRLLQWVSKIVVALLISSNNAAVSHAAELTHVDVNSDGGVYRIRLEMKLDIAADYVSEVLTDYRHIYRLNPSIVESRLLASPNEGTSRVYTRMEGCVLFYCTEFIRVEDVRELDSGDLVAVIVPELSDFGSGAALWQITQQGERSQLVYEANFQPGFFVPPLVGSYFVKKKLKAEIMMAFQRVECNAKVRLWAKELGNDGVFGKKAKSMVC